jgi:hypothetical protein
MWNFQHHKVVNVESPMLSYQRGIKHGITVTNQRGIFNVEFSMWNFQCGIANVDFSTWIFQRGFFNVDFQRGFFNVAMLQCCNMEPNVEH